MMRLSDVLQKKGANAVTVSASASVATAIQTMYQNRVGSVIVPSDGGKPIGILTERDIMRLCAQGKRDFENLLVKDCMTASPVLGSPDDRITEVLTVMTNKRFRHMPVVKDDQIIGIISIGDLVKAKLEETAEEAQALRDYITS